MGKPLCYVLASLALLLLGILGILLLAIPTRDVREAPDYMYGIIFDAGSSHTGMYIYKWPADKQNGTGIVAQHSQCHVKGPGISGYAGEPGGAGRSLESCLKQAMQDIPKLRHSQSPVYLGATAGMRLLQMSNRNESDRIMLEVKSKIQSYPFKFQGASILSGQAEGAFGWVTVNYLLENFVKYGFVGRWLSPGKKTVGALDLGGASTQITYVTQEAVEDSNNIKNLRLYGKNYSLYTQSFLCYGRDQVLRRILAKLMKTQGYGDSITHPCYPTDYIASLKFGDIFDSPCTAGQKPTAYDPQQPVRVLGIGSYPQCLGNVSKLFSFSRCSFSKCSFDDVFQPNLTGSFMAFSAFYYTHTFLQRVTGIAASTPSLLDSASKAVCKMKFEEMLAKAPDQEKRLQDYCAVSAFLQVLLVQGYGFNDVSFPDILFQKKAGDTSIGWALGYMLTLSNLIPAESAGFRKALRPEAWNFLLALFGMLLFCVLAYILWGVRSSKKGSASVI